MAMPKSHNADFLRFISVRTRYKFKVFFKTNSYCSNKVIIKEYKVRYSGQVAFLSGLKI